MLRPVIIVVALVALMPAAASMQVVPGQPASPEWPEPPTPMAMEASQDTPRATTSRPGMLVDTQIAPAAPRAPQGPPPPSTTPAPTPQPPRKIRGRDLNVQVELTISDQLANAAPEKRLVSMMIADGAFGRIRSTDNPLVAMLNVDARPEILDNDRLVVEMTIEYRPLAPDGTAPTKRPTGLNEQLTVILQNGKPLMVSQAADPVADRKMTVEVRATILK